MVSSVKWMHFTDDTIKNITPIRKKRHFHGWEKQKSKDEEL